MKNLVKFRLINWHYFSNTTCDIKNITFLTGPNGTGKSTVIDALQILILGTTRPDNFNKAANEKGRSGRNLLSYLRGQTGYDDNGNVIDLRTGTFTSYLAIEIFDDVEQRTFTLGCLFDVDSADNIDKHYFYLDSPFPENDFSTGEGSKKRPMMYREFSPFVRSHYKANHFRFFDSDADYQSFIKVAFGNLPEKYFSLFKKAVSFTPISDISTFITEYICDADINVDITPMQKNIEQYKILENQARELSEKESILQNIQSTYAEYAKYERSLKMLTYVNDRVNYEEAQKKLESLQEKLKKDNQRLLEISNQTQMFDAQIADLSDDLSSFQAKKLSSSNYSLTEKISLKKENVTRSVTAIQMAAKNALNKIEGYGREYAETAGRFASFYGQFDSARLGDEKLAKAFDELVSLSRDIANEGKAIAESAHQGTLDLDALKAFRNDMEMLKSEATGLKSQLTNQFYLTSDKLQSLQNDLSAVNNGKKPFDKLGPSYLAIRDSLRTALKARHQDAYLNIYCDLIDVNDPEWTMALEAVLFNQKFNFFVNPAYYEEANRLLKQLCDSYHYYHVSLVDTERLLHSGIEANPDSIALLIDTKDEGARAYTDYLLGRIKKCSTFEEARASGSGLLSDATGYRGFATWYLNKNNARIFYLGTKVSDSTMALSAKDYQEVNQRYSLLSEALNQIGNLLALPLMSENERAGYVADLSREGEVKNLESQIASLDSEMKKVSSGGMDVVDSKIQEIVGKIKDLRNQRENLLTERGSLLSEVNRLNGTEIPSAQALADNYKKELLVFDPEVANKEYDPFYNRLLDVEKLTLAQIRNQATKEYIQAQNALLKTRDNLTKLRSDYVNRYHVNFSVSETSSNAEFDEELERISQVQLPEYRQKIQEAHDASVREFKDDFIYKLRTAIDTVNSQIEELNQALSDCQFGRDVYQFRVTPNKDYKSYYDMIMDPLLLKAGDAESLFMEKYKTVMDDLFSLISSSTSAAGEQLDQILKNIETFTNYTTYLTFDLLVTRGLGEEKKTISLARSFKSQSGGETQTPFYIAILASFASLCRANNPKDNNTLRLVIFDEAFSKMDSARIMKSVDLLRQFSLQGIISTPSEKLRDLVSFVDLILVTIHDEKHKKSGIDVYEDKRRAKKEEEERKEKEAKLTQETEAALPSEEEKK